MATIKFFEFVNANVNVVKFTPNSLVLIKRKESILRNGDVKVKHNVLVVENVIKGIKPVELVKGLIYSLLAEGKQTNDFNGMFEDINVKARKEISTYLNSFVIFKTNKDGYIKQAITSETKLNKTALNIKKNSILYSLTGKELHNAVHKFACACLIQFNWYEILNNNLNKLLDGTQEQAKEQEQELAQIEAKPVVFLPVAPVVDIAPVEIVVSTQEQAQTKKQAK